MASSSSKKNSSSKKKKKTTSSSHSSSFLRTVLVGMVMGILLFIFIAFITTSLPENLQGERSIRDAFQILLIEIPTQPFVLLAKLIGFSISNEILFFCSLFSYALFGAIINFLWQKTRKKRT